MRVLVACEFSGVVRDAFAARGHDAWSCDLLPTESPGNHIQGDVLAVLDQEWDLMVAHPPCTYLTVAGQKAMTPKHNPKYRERETHRLEAVAFVSKLWAAPIPRIAIENPVGHLPKLFMPYHQLLRMNDFGENAYKPTCLWLKNLPPLMSVIGCSVDSYRSPNGRQCSAWYARRRRSKERSQTFAGFAAAMAAQWG